MRTTDAAFEVPERLRSSRAGHPPDSALVYLSLGSLGSADIDLMRRLVDILGSTRHRFVVSKGPLADEYELPANMCGAAQVPQTSVLPQVDLVITHGGNNTTTESIHFGKPMVVLPLFWDQYDNAQRVDELGFGRRLPTYSFTDDELIGAVDELLADTALRRRVAEVGVAVRARDGVAAAAHAPRTDGLAQVGAEQMVATARAPSRCGSTGSVTSRLVRQWSRRRSISSSSVPG